MRGPRRINAFIYLFLALQLAAPLEYYCARADANDERFAWRMFSPTRMLSCQPEFTVGEARRPVALMSSFHEAWVTIAQRGRLDVIERMGRVLCHRNPGQAVYLRLRCSTVDGQTTEQGGWDLCSYGEL
jgi:hypothetical protein